MQDIMDQIEGLHLEKRELLNIEIEQIQMLGWDFLQAVKVQDMVRVSMIFRIFLKIAKHKTQVPSLQAYFKGRQIGLFPHSIDIDKCTEYVLFVTEQAKNMGDPRTMPTPVDVDSEVGPQNIY